MRGTWVVVAVGICLAAGWGAHSDHPFVDHTTDGRIVTAYLTAAGAPRPAANEA